MLVMVSTAVRPRGKNQFCAMLAYAFRIIGRPMPMSTAPTSTKSKLTFTIRRMAIPTMVMMQPTFTVNAKPLRTITGYVCIFYYFQMPGT